MKKMNFKKIATMGLAAMMAASAMSVSAFAEEDVLITTIYDVNDNPVEIYESDLENGEVTVNTGNKSSITLGFADETQKSIDSRAVPGIGTGSFRSTQPSTKKYVAEDYSYELSYSVAPTKILFTPYKFAPTNSDNAVRFYFYPDETDDGDSALLLYGFARETASDDYESTEYSLTERPLYLIYRHYETVYTQLHNSFYSGTAKGYCMVENYE